MNAGERHPRATLTDDQVRAIRAATCSLSAIARQFGCSRRHVMRIRAGYARKTAAPCP